MGFVDLFVCLLNLLYSSRVIIIVFLSMWVIWIAIINSHKEFVHWQRLQGCWCVCVCELYFMLVSEQIDWVRWGLSSFHPYVCIFICHDYCYYCYCRHFINWNDYWWTTLIYESFVTTILPHWICAHTLIGNYVNECK